MVELHCWINLRETCEITEDENTGNLLPVVREELEKFELEYYNIQIKGLNGEYYIEFSIYENHMASAKEALSLFSRVGEIAKGSYGLLHIHDDEDEGIQNSFRTWRLARGKVTVYKDDFLSPYIPTVSDD